MNPVIKSQKFLRLHRVFIFHKSDSSAIIVLHLMAGADNLVRAILFDTRSIQRYIFSGNRLKTNIGASYLVAHVFDDYLIPVLKNAFGDSQIDVDSWKQGNPLAGLSDNILCSVAYIGGGNALILFREDIEHQQCVSLVEDFTCELLVKCPGLRVGVAHGKLDIDSVENFQSDLSELYRQLKKNQNTVSPVVTVPYTGLTLNCRVNGKTANYFDLNGKVQPEAGYEQSFYSQETASKAFAATKANEHLRSLYPEVCKSYDFPMQFEDLGQVEGENYIAIIHIDGNNMGKKFCTCKTLQERSKLSRNIQFKVERCFGRLLNTIVDEYDSYKKFLKLGLTEQYKNILPIRPLILGGDDVTFICPAKLAVIYTKRFMEFMIDTETVDGIEDERAKYIDCCAGIGIFKTSYPFFRGYELAEQVCDFAKQKMRSMAEQNVGTSWLDFIILHGEQALTLKQIRDQEYSAARGNMHFGPYQVGNTGATGNQECRYNIENLLECVSQFQNGTMAKNKIKEMRLILQHSKHDAQRFLTQLEKQGQHLPHIDAWIIYEKTESALWHNNKTPYIDAIEMIDFIPEVQ